MAWILASVLSPVCKRMMDDTIEEYKLVRDVNDEIMNLRRTVFVIMRKLEVAEGKQVESHAIHLRLKELKQVLFDAEDVFDEIATDEALEKDAEEGTSRQPKVRKLNIFGVDISLSSSAIANRRAIAHRVKDINKKFDDILRDEEMLGLHVSNEPNESVDRPIRRTRQDTSSLLPKEARIIGRDDEMRKLEELLLEYSEEGTVAATTHNYKNVHVISVVGMGGVGKTTLVQHAYNSPAVAEYFQPRMWVCASNDFDVKRITGEIMEAAEFNSKKIRDKFVDPPNWDVVQKSLQGKLEGKRFLLVLDDVWEEDPSKWDSLCIPLMYGGKGSKIIMTTRSQKVASITKSTPIFLKDLPSDDLWSIFQTYAFDDHDPDKNTQLEILGRKIVDQLKGSPLAAKTIGRLLNSNQDVKHWKNIMKSKTWVSLDFKNGIVPILKLSYDYLPGHLKQCFAYCSLFPEDHHFDKDKLVQLWMAQQFIQSHIKSMGGEYFDDLVCMSLFEKYTNDDGQESFVMHDLIHNLAEIVSEEDCLRLEDNQHNGTISDTVRHVSIASYRFDPTEIEQLCNKCENMRTLLFLRGCPDEVLDPHLDNIFNKLRRLRVLRLSNCGLHGHLPTSIGALKHLRLLDLSYNRLSELPESLCDLRNLQVLNLYGCHEIRALPRNMSALINLRHLYAKGELVSGIQGLGKLTALHDLGHFDCVRQPIKELADMGMLRGRLRITSLEKVKSREEAAGSRLDKKEHLDELTLRWRDDDHNDVNNPGLEEEVLDGLQPPHKSIWRLSIYNYGGSRSPSWMEDQSWLRDPCFLRSLKLYNCTNWKVLPSLGQLPSLQVLKFYNMEEWEEWEAPLGTDDDGGEDDQVLLEALPPPPPPRRQHHRRPLFLARLRELTIWDCPKLRQLPPLPPTLTQLEIVNVGLTHLPEWWLPPSSASSLLPCCSSSSPSLSSLKIEDCPELISLADGLLRHPLPNLVKLVIKYCEGLVSLPPDTAFGHLTSLKELVVERCPELAWPPPTLRRSLPSSLQDLTIRDNDQLDDQTLSAWLRGLTSLRELWIEDCPAVTSLPRAEVLSHLTALEKLEIRRLGALESFGGGVHCLVSLEELIILDCPELLDITTTTAADSSRPSSSSSALPSPARYSVGTSTTRIRRLVISGSSMQQMIKTLLLQCPSLQELSISFCPQLTGFGGNHNDGGDDDGGDVLLEAALLNLSGTLQRLEFYSCENLRSLPPRLRCLSSLQSLEIQYCPQIRSLPVAGLPDSLRKLGIQGCPALEEWCKEARKGSEYRFPDFN